MRGYTWSRHRGGEVLPGEHAVHITAASPGPGWRGPPFSAAAPDDGGGTAIPPCSSALDSAATGYTSPGPSPCRSAQIGGDHWPADPSNAVNGWPPFPTANRQAASGYSLRPTGSGLPNATRPASLVPGPESTRISRSRKQHAGAARSSASQVTAYDAFGNQATLPPAPPGRDRTQRWRVGAGHAVRHGAVPAWRVATFSNLSIDVVGNGYTLTAAFAGGSRGREPALQHHVL